MINALRRRLRHAQNSFPAGGVLFALLLGYFVYRKVRSADPTPAGTAVAWRDLDGTDHGGADFGEHRATVLFFTSAQCPCADVFSAPMVRVARDYAPQGVRFFAVFSNGSEAVAEIRRFASDRQFGFPVVKDEQGVLANRLRSAVTPSAVILDATGAVRYSGAIGQVPETPNTPADCNQLVSVLTAVLAGGNPILTAAARPLGCAIVGMATAGLPNIEAQDNRRPAGRLEHGVLTVRLRTEIGVWSPEKKDGAGFPMYVFREEGGALVAPGPLIRVPAGTEIRVTIKNTVTGPPLEVHGLPARVEAADPVVTIAAGEEREIRWQAETPGTFVYWASVGPPRTTFAESRDALLNGGLVVDPAGSVPDPHERIFVLNEYLERAPDSGSLARDRTGEHVRRRRRLGRTFHQRDGRGNPRFRIHARGARGTGTFADQPRSNRGGAAGVCAVRSAHPLSAACHLAALPTGDNGCAGRTELLPTLSPTARAATGKPPARKLPGPARRFHPHGSGIFARSGRRSRGQPQGRLAMELRRPTRPDWSGRAGGSFCQEVSSQ
jgi:hypothetical protein